MCVYINSYISSTVHIHNIGVEYDPIYIYIQINIYIYIYIIFIDCLLIAYRLPIARQCVQYVRYVQYIQYLHYVQYVRCVQYVQHVQCVQYVQYVQYVTAILSDYGLHCKNVYLYMYICIYIYIFILPAYFVTMEHGKFPAARIVAQYSSIMTTFQICNSNIMISSMQ